MSSSLATLEGLSNANPAEWGLTESKLHKLRNAALRANLMQAILQFISDARKNSSVTDSTITSAGDTLGDDMESAMAFENLYDGLIVALMSGDAYVSIYSSVWPIV